jgi:hypothetical protein
MPQWVRVLGTSHQLQGGNFAGRRIRDPSYEKHVRSEIESRRFDFVFEEAAGLGPTIAENLTRELLDHDHYLDVDPPVAIRASFGIANPSGHSFPISPYELGSRDVIGVEYVDPQDRRETLWLDRIAKTSFTSALFVCGYLHALSFSFSSLLKNPTPLQL